MANAAEAGPPLRPGQVPLVGRARELSVLADCLAEAPAGRVSVVLVAGEPGSGKTRLLDEFRPRALAAGAATLRGGASQAEGMPPYLPFLEALGEYVAAAARDDLRAALGANASILAPLLPGIPARLGALPALYPLPPAQERLRLYEAVASFLGTVAAPGGLVLALDDIHWADGASCDLLIHVARRLQASPLLIVAAYRDGEVEDNAALMRALAELNRRRLSVTLRLGPLSAEESAALASGLLRGDVAPEVSALVHRQGEGNPFFEEELLRALVEDNALARREGRWTLGQAPQSLLPAGIIEAIRMRLARLAPEVVDLLRVAAIAGRAFSVGLLATVASRDAEEVEDLLLAATRARLIQAEPHGGYAFTHDKVRETLYIEVSGARRRRLHRAIGEALEAGAGEGDQRTADLAFHFVQAGDTTRGVSYALAAGEEALRGGAAQEAAAYYRAAVDLLPGRTDEARRSVALLGVAEASLHMDDYRQAAVSYRAVAAATLGADRLMAARAWRGLGHVHWRQEAVGDAEAAFERSLELLGPEDSAEAAEALLDVADLRMSSLGQHAAGLSDGERALAMVERLGDPRLEATACRVIGNLKLRTGQPAEGQVLLERALALAWRQDNPVLAAETCGHLANLYYVRGDPQRSWEITHLREHLAWRIQNPFLLRHVDSWRALLRLSTGDWQAAEQLLTQAERAVAPLESPEPRVDLQMNRGKLRYYQGRFQEAADELNAAVTTARREIGANALVWHLGWLGLALAELEQRDKAHACFDELEALVQARYERATDRGYALSALVVGYVRLDLPRQAAACYTPLHPFSGQALAILVDRALSLAAACTGDRAAALRHLASAEEQARRGGLRPELALTLLQRGRLERQEGMPSGASQEQAPVAEGLRLCDELGMQALGRRALGMAPARPGQVRPPRPLWPDGLSARQVEVLRLVAEGRTNREIARMLFLSEGTVANHLTAIFTKARVDNRAAAVAYALRHGLA